MTNNKVETAIAQMASKDKDIPIITNPLIAFALIKLNLGLLSWLFWCIFNGKISNATYHSNKGYKRDDNSYIFH